MSAAPGSRVGIHGYTGDGFERWAATRAVGLLSLCGLLSVSEQLVIKDGGEVLHSRSRLRLERLF